MAPTRNGRIVLASFLTGALLLGGCADSLPSLPKIGDLNPFKEKQTPLPGKRIAILPAAEKIPGELADASAPIALPPERVNDTWAQPGGDANNAPGHLALAASVRQTWSADAGTGSSKAGRVTASPIVFDGRVYALDAEGAVSAFSLGGGSAIWRVSLKPAPSGEKSSGFSASDLFSLGGDSGGGYGGGLAADGGRLYGTSGFGGVVALDPATGKRLWEKDLGVPIRAAPTAAGDRIFVVTIEGRFYCLSGIDGAEIWTTRGAPQTASRVMNVSPAVDNDIVIVPYPSGDLVALKIIDGSPVWSESLARTRSTSQLTSMSDAARPAVEGGIVFAVGHAGRMIATDVKTGERLWSLNVPSTQTPWVAGDSVFVVDTTGQLLAISRREGKVLWTIKLPGGTQWSGPTLAGNTLWLASSTGTLVGADAMTGRVTSQQDLGTPVFVAPVVAQSKMFVLTDSAQLIALN
ncbi:MAG: outer membrane protein assembly factor BamB family protein [Hyphomicrobium sp.]